MLARPERSREESYKQAEAALRLAAMVTAPLFGQEKTGLVVVVDIAGMGRVNARHGVPAGDRLLCAIEASLQRRLGGEGRAVRLAGDQFLVVVPGTPSIEQVVHTVLLAVTTTRVAGRMHLPVKVGAHIGVATWNEQVPPQAAVNEAGRSVYEQSPQNPQDAPIVMSE